MAYQTLRCNVDLLKLIQLGLSFTDEEGNWVDGCTCWQFNFHFSLSEDMYAQDSIALLKSSGINFERFETFGIDVKQFGELMMMSGLDTDTDTDTNANTNTNTNTNTNANDDVRFSTRRECEVDLIPGFI